MLIIRHFDGVQEHDVLTGAPFSRELATTSSFFSVQ